MKRYRIKLGPRSVNILEHPSGGWYSCEDVDAEIESLIHGYEIRISVLKEARHDKFKPKPERKGTLTINIQGDIINEEAFFDALVKRLNEEMKK